MVRKDRRAFLTSPRFLGLVFQLRLYSPLVLYSLPYINIKILAVISPAATDDSSDIAGLGLEPRASGNEPDKFPLLYPAKHNRFTTWRLLSLILLETYKELIRLNGADGNRTRVRNKY